MIAVVRGKQSSRRSQSESLVGVVHTEGRKIREQKPVLEPLPADRAPQAPSSNMIDTTMSDMTGASMLTTIGTPIATASLIFDRDWYNREYPDVAAVNLDPVRHYLDNGSREGRNPNPYFDTNWYVSNNPDVAAAGLNPFLHYLLYGAREGRLPAP